MKKIALLLGGVGYDNQKRFINGILDTALADGTDVYIFTCDAWSYGARHKYEKGEYNIYNLPDFTQYDGVIINTVTIHDLETVDLLIQRIIESGTPCVSLNNKWENAICITMENEKGTRLVAEHLINEHNVGSIYYISGPMDSPHAQERLDVLKDVMDEYHIEWDEDNIYYGDMNYQDGVRAVEHFLKLDRPLPEAIMAYNDLMAIGAIQKLTSMGYHVPNDVIVTGYDDSDIAALNNPRVTSVLKGMYASGEMAYEKLKQVWSTGEPVEDGFIYGKPVFSQSCGCSRRGHSSHPHVQELYVKRIMEHDSALTLLKASAAEFTGLGRFRDLMVSLRKYIRLINPEYFYLCINHDATGNMNELDRIEAGYGMVRDTSAYMDDMSVPFAYERGRINQYKMFDKSLLLPPDREKVGSASFYVVLPIHHEDCCFGYCVIGNCKAVIERPLFQHFIMNVGNALETIRRQEAMKTIMQKMNQMWRNDELTGLLNRSGFHDEVNRILETAVFRGSSVSLFFIDTDGLKKVNDMFGHDEGDIFIKAMANILSGLCPPDYMVCRYGGDEFIVLAVGLTEVETQSFKNKIQAAMDQYNKSHSHEWKLDASIGLWFEQNAADVDMNRIIELADQDMYKIKRKKKTSRSGEGEMGVIQSFTAN